MAGTAKNVRCPECGQGLSLQKGLIPQHRRLGEVMRGPLVPCPGSGRALDAANDFLVNPDGDDLVLFNRDGTEAVRLPSMAHATAEVRDWLDRLSKQGKPRVTAAL